MNTKEYSILPEITGVIHVGANVGQEMQAYSDYGLSVVWVEPLPSIFKLLQENLQGQNCTIKQKAYRYLVTDEDDKVTVIHATNNWGLSSSILELKLHKEMEPNIFVHHDVSMKSITLPTLIERENIDMGVHNALILDTQGTELTIIKGAEKILDQFDFIKTEAADFESYAGCCQVDDINAYMSTQNFELVNTRHNGTWQNIGSYYDLTYKNKGRYGPIKHKEVVPS